MAASQKLRFEDGVKPCECRNVCTRSEKRGACPCLSNELYCTDLCKCGTVKQECCNRYGKGGALDVLFGVEPQATEFENDPDSGANEVLVVGTENGHVNISTSELNTSMQAAALEQFPITGTVDVSWQAEVPQLLQSDSDLTSMLRELDLTTAVRILGNIIRENPSLVTYVTSKGDSADPPSPPNPGQDVPGWCFCGNCREMPTPLEQSCCRQKVGKCILCTASEQIRTVVLDLHVLTAAVRNRNDLFSLQDDVNSNRTLRHTAYRQFVLWRFGHLGTGNRIVIPSCVVWKIRSMYPEQNGQYTGFRVNRFN